MLDRRRAELFESLMKTTIRYLPDATLASLDISPAELVEAVETALVAMAEGRLHTAPKSVILPGDGRYLMSTLAAGNPGSVVVKQVSVCPDNAERDLPTINGAILVLDGETGLLRALLGANWITAFRTAALSAVAARHLAHPEAQSLTLIGSGVQARSHLAVFAELFPLGRVRVLGRGQANIERLCDQARALGLDAMATDDPEAALVDADIIVSSTTLDHTIEPFLDARWLKPGAFASITDACIPWRADTLSAFESVIVDDREQEAASKRPMLSPDLISDDLVGLVVRASHGFDRAAKSAFAFRGLALGDYAVAGLALERAEERDVGLTLP
jgi:ornithine cyclodeaminase/alanine dehydrogenase